LNIDVLCTVSSLIDFRQARTSASHVVNKEQKRVRLVNETGVSIHHVANKPGIAA
jgi:hypothetical protein